MAASRSIATCFLFFSAGCFVTFFLPVGSVRAYASIFTQKKTENFLLCFKFFRIFVESNINVLPTGMVQSKDSENSKVELRRRITVSALEAFKEKGIKAVRMDDIAKRLNISKRTLYEVFEDKKELIYECITCKHMQEMERQKELNRQAGNVLERVFMEMVSSIEAFNQTSPEFYRDLQKYPRFIELKNKHIEQNRTEAVKFLEKGKAQGLFRSDVRFDLILDLLHLQLENTFEKHLDSKYDIKEIFYYVVVTLFRGCATAKGLQVINDFLEKYPNIIPKHIKTNDA